MRARTEIIFLVLLVALSVWIKYAQQAGKPQATLSAHSDMWQDMADCTLRKSALLGQYSISFTPQMQALNHKTVSIDGFVLPLESAPRFNHFLLSARSPTCSFCPSGEPNEMIEVFSKEPLSWSDQKVAVRGTLKLMEEKNDKAIFFQLWDAQTLAVQSMPEVSAPPFATKALGDYVFTKLSDDAPQALHKWKGQLLVVGFWRSDCPPCLEEMKALPQIATQHPETSMVFISLQDAQHTRKHIKPMPPNVHLLVSKDDGRSLLAAFGNERVLALPYSVMLDAKGEICAKHNGILSSETISQWRKQCS